MTTDERRRLMRSLCGRIREAHLAKDYGERNRLCKEHDDLALSLPAVPRPEAQEPTS